MSRGLWIYQGFIRQAGESPSGAFSSLQREESPENTEKETIKCEGLMVGLSAFLFLTVRIGF